MVLATDAEALASAEREGTAAELPDAGLALVGATTSMASVRAQLVEAIDESAAAEDGQQNVVDLLKGGKFSFLLPRAGRPRRTVVMKAQEKLVRGAAAMGDPVALMPTAAARRRAARRPGRRRRRRRRRGRATPERGRRGGRRGVRDPRSRGAEGRR